MTEPTPLPLTSGSSPSEPHAANLDALAGTAESGCCGGHAHSAETPITMVSPLAETPVRSIGQSGACGSHVEHPAHDTHAGHASHAVHAAHDGHAVHAAHDGHAIQAAHEVAHASAPLAHGHVSHDGASHDGVSHASPALAAVATIAPAAVATDAPAHSLHGHAGSLTPLTDATAQDIEAALRSAQKARASQAVAQAARPKGSDLIARKLVLRRDRWDSLLKLTNALRAQRGIVATPAEVAAIVLDAGLNVILEESAQAARPKADMTVAPIAAEKSPGRRAAKVSAVEAIVSTAPALQPAESPAAAVSLAPTATPLVATSQVPTLTATLTVKPRTFHGVEIAHIRKTVRGLPSARSIQRTLGLWLGANVLPAAEGRSSVGVPIEDLRALCREFKVYDTANFAQNMKKDAAFFAEVRNAQGERLGYDLTPKGRDAAASFLLAAVPAKAVSRKPSRPAPRATKRPASRKRAKVSAKRRGR